MSQIDPIRVESFFAEFLLPLRRSNARRNVHYLNLARQQASYWGPTASRTGGLERLPADACDAVALLERLGNYWVAQGDANLPKLLPYLMALRAKIVDPALGESVEEAPMPEFVYPMF
jgi:hypothetical protein